MLRMDLSQSHSVRGSLFFPSRLPRICQLPQLGQACLSPHPHYRCGKGTQAFAT